MQQNNRPKVIGITGSIGSGKTTVCKIIEADYPVFYADKIAHQVLEHKQVKKKLISRWGKSIIANDKLNRKAIADIVFNNQAELGYLNSVVHPVVLKSMQENVDKLNDKLIFFEIPLLFEADLRQCFDLVVLIIAKKQTRISRLQKRDHLSKNDIQNRINAQTEDEIKVKMADLVINNDGTLVQIQEKVKQFVNTISTYPYRDIRPFYSI
ncbi:MAG: dephospho-CoA kinase [Candidatus Cloacimonadaceae bacterium]